MPRLGGGGGLGGGVGHERGDSTECMYIELMRRGNPSNGRFHYCICQILLIGGTGGPGLH